jgi:hypothetical protein
LPQQRIIPRQLLLGREQINAQPTSHDGPATFALTVRYSPASETSSGSVDALFFRKQPPRVASTCHGFPIGFRRSLEELFQSIAQMVCFLFVIASGELAPRSK